LKIFRFLNKQAPTSSRKRRLKLISVHIPKTAGTSFRKSLKAAYGEEEVVRLDISLQTGQVRLNEEKQEERILPTGTRVLHGHFRPADIWEHYPETKDLPFITWLRNPVERVISNYYYLEKRLKEELDEEGKNLNILSKMQRSLLEYARDDINRNRQHKFLEGMPLEDFEFVGILEHYAEDLAELGRRLGWKEVEATTVNVTSGKKPIVSEETREEIARLNGDDMALYQHALHLRTRRKETPKLELISIHVPKTAGTSFYKTLREVYGTGVTIPFRRGNLRRTLERFGSLEQSLTGEKKVIHGHLYYPEIARLRELHDAKVVAWVRNPVDRVISNYRFFKAGLEAPYRNLNNYELNKHRKDESLETYAKMEENRNVMTGFLSGIDLEDFYFVGVQEHYAEDLSRLAKRLGWPAVASAYLNQSEPSTRKENFQDPAVRQMIKELNQDDYALYEKALQRRKLEINGDV
jgi:hypothetical protein